VGKRAEIPEKVKKELWIRSGGRCELCNKDLTNAYLSRGKAGNYSQMAHIVAYGAEGPRAVEFAIGNNSYDNLMLLCYDCHKTIDDNPNDYSVEYLKRMKSWHCEKVKKALDMLTMDLYTIVEYSSTVFGNNQRMSSDEINGALVEANLFCDNKKVILEDRNDESINVINVLGKNFDKRIRSDWDDGHSPKYCIFSFGPMYCLIKLGSLFSNYKNEIKIAIKTRKKWILTEDKETLIYSINKPEIQKQAKEVVLELNISAPSNETQINSYFLNLDVWSITTTNPGMDIVTDLADVRHFGRVVTEVLDTIIREYSVDVTIHVVPRICNALAIQFGMSVMPKVHKNLKIYDVTRNGIEFKYDLFNPIFCG